MTDPVFPVGGVDGGLVGIIHPGLSAQVGGIVGGIACGVSGVYLNDPYGDVSFADYANAAVFGGSAGGLTGAIGGYFTAASYSIGVSGAAVDIAASMITSPIGLGLSIGV